MKTISVLVMIDVCTVAQWGTCGKWKVERMDMVNKSSF